MAKKALVKKTEPQGKAAKPPIPSRLLAAVRTVLEDAGEGDFEELDDEDDEMELDDEEIEVEEPDEEEIEVEELDDDENEDVDDEDDEGEE